MKLKADLFQQIKKLKTIDILIIAGFVFASIFSILHFRREKETIFIDVNNEPNPSFFWEVAKLNKGDIVYNSTGEKIAWVDNVESYDWGGNRNAVVVTLEVKAVYHDASKTYSINGGSLAVGSKLPFTLGSVSFDGTIMNIYKNREDRFNNYSKKEKAEVEVMYRSIEPWVAKQIKDATIKNSQGDVLLSVKEAIISPADLNVTTDRGDVLWRKHSWLKDVIVTLELTDNVICRQDICSFGYQQPLKVGSDFWMQGNNLVIGNGSIMGVTIY